ncbi:hypothetical protein MKX01_006076, partial [Papaver californicum]
MVFCVFFIYLFSVANLLIIQHTTAQPVFVLHVCLGSNYTTNSTFQKNLNILLPSISSANTSYGYYNATAGRNPDTIITEKKCPESKQAIIWYEECMLRYSDQYYFNLMQDSPRVFLRNFINVTDPDKFNPILSDLMNGLVSKAISNGSLNFATGYTSLLVSRKYMVAIDVSLKLSLNYPICCDGKQGGRVLRPSCNVRYETYPFAQSSILPPSSTNMTKRNSSLLAVSIVIPSVIAVLSTIAFWFFCFRRKRTKTRKSDNVDDEMPTTKLQFNFSTISVATDNFSEAIKLGEGGFGSVYK